MQERPHYTTANQQNDKPSLLAWVVWAIVAIAIVIAMTATYFWGRSQATVEMIEIAIPTPAPIIVQVEGEVQNPGVYRLERGSRVLDAIETAGGGTRNSDPQRLNLAAFVQDGARVVVPAVTDQNGQAASIIESTSAEPATESSTGNPASAVGSASNTQTLLNINTATKEQLMTLPGIGEVRALQIIAMRQEQGGFTSIEDLLNISGIGDKTLEAIRPHLTIQ